MSTFKVEVKQINGVSNHPNADRLELISIDGWQCVAQKGKYKTGDQVIYLPIDAVLPPEIECALFPADAKVRLTKSRIRTIKLRGAISQGMVVDLPTFAEKTGKVSVGDDVTAALGVTKYEPPQKDLPAHMQGPAAKPRKTNPNFNKYTDIENFKNYIEAFSEGETVYITEKLHGTSARYGIVDAVADTWWKKVKHFFGAMAKHEFVFGSRNVQLQNKLLYKGYYDQNVYAMIAKKYDIEAKLLPGEQLFGEIVGDGIQGGYTYGCGKGEYKFFAYDVKKDGKWLDPNEFKKWCDDRSISRVPELFYGPFTKATADQLRDGDSTIGNQKVREGIVIKPSMDCTAYFGRKIVKYISDAYLLGDQTDFH
jgi:RNA ligase (TIGR02306 family)